MKHLRWVAAALLSFEALGCGTKGSASTPSPSGANPDVLQLGFIFSQTGSESDIGLEVQSGINVAVSQINALGGVLGQQIVLVPEDDMSDLTGMAGLAAANTLIQQGITVGFGPTANPSASQVGSRIAKDQMLLVSPSATQQSLDSLGGSSDAGVSCATTGGASSNPVFFRTTPSDLFLGTAMALTASTPITSTSANFCGEAVSIVVEDDADGVGPTGSGGVAAEVKAEMVNASIKVNSINKIPAASTDPTDPNLIAAATQVVMDAGNGKMASGTTYDSQCQLVVAPPALAGAYMLAFRNVIASAMYSKQRDWTSFQTIGSDGFYQPAFINDGCLQESDPNCPTISAANGTYAVAADTAPSSMSDETRAFAAFLNLYQAAYPGVTPGGDAATAYDAAILLAAAIQRTGNATDLPTIRQNLFAISLGLGGTGSSATAPVQAVSPEDLVDMFTRLNEGQNLNYAGASGPCDFLPTGSVLTDFQVWNITSGNYDLLTQDPNLPYSPGALAGTSTFCSNAQ
jgi:ABC-type branched-subunit amino acid transport system substrate-binding protein